MSCQDREYRLAVNFFCSAKSDEYGDNRLIAVDKALRATWGSLRDGYNKLDFCEFVTCAQKFQRSSHKNQRNNKYGVLSAEQVFGIHLFIGNWGSEIWWPDKLENVERSVADKTVKGASTGRNQGLHWICCPQKSPSKWTTFPSVPFHVVCPSVSCIYTHSYTHSYAHKC